MISEIFDILKLSIMPISRYYLQQMCIPGAFKPVLRRYDWSIFHHNIIIYVQDIEHMRWTFSSLYPCIIGDILIMSVNYGQEIESHSKSLNKAR